MKKAIKIILFILIIIFNINFVFSDLTENNTIYYKFDENANDVFGNINGIVTNAVLTTSKINNGYSFDGTNDYISLTTDMLETPKGTISFWIKTNTDQKYIMDFGAINFLVGANQVGGATSGKISFNYYDVGWKYIESSTTINNNQWYFITASWNSTSIKLYINGELENNKSVSSIRTTLTRQAHIGSSYSPAIGYQFIGLIDEISIYDIELNIDLIEELYNNGNGLQYPYESTTTNTNLAHKFEFYNSETNTTQNIFNTYRNGNIKFYEKVGINTDTPSQELDVVGNIIAESYLDYTPYYSKEEEQAKILNIKNIDLSVKNDLLKKSEPKEIIKNIKSNNDGHIDHNSLHPFMITEKKEYYKVEIPKIIQIENCFEDKNLLQKNKTICKIENKEITVIENRYNTTEKYRNIGNSITINQIVLKELIEEIEDLKKELCLHNYYKWC